MRFLLSISLALMLVNDVSAFGHRHRVTYSKSQVTRTTPHSTSTVTRESIKGNTSTMSAMMEVNAARAARGLPPFIEDPALTAAAQNAASARANILLSGHLPNDFSFLPPGTFALAAGCGALTPSWGWGTCCTYENYRFAGAGMVWGRDGKRYMHIFVR